MPTQTKGNPTLEKYEPLQKLAIHIQKKIVCILPQKFVELGTMGRGDAAGFADLSG